MPLLVEPKVIRLPDRATKERLEYTNKMLTYLKQLNCNDDELMEAIGEALSISHSRLDCRHRR